MPKVFKKSSSHSVSQHHIEMDEDPLKVFLTWRAPSRPFRKKDRSYYTTIAIIVVLLSLILLLAHEFLLIGAILSLTFVAYVLSFIAPEDIDYKVSSQGITVGEHFYTWHELDSFWFTHKEGYDILHIYTNLSFPSVLLLPLGPQDKEELRRVLSHYIIFLEVVPKNFMEDWAEKLQKTFPLERIKK